MDIAGVPIAEGNIGLSVRRRAMSKLQTGSGVRSGTLSEWYQGTKKAALYAMPRSTPFAERFFQLEADLGWTV
jgi:hypothetical protein